MPVRLGVIAGPEVYELLRQGLLRSERRYAMNTPFGEAQPVYQAVVDERSFLFLPRQGDGGGRVPPSAVNYRANIYALKELGAQVILAWSGPAALAPQLSPGTFVLPEDLIDLTRHRSTTFFERSARGLLPQGPVFCPELRETCRRALDRLGVEVVSGGTYVCTEGPRLETPVEVRLFASWGGTLVGMTLCPEVFLARELGIPYAPLCCVTGHAAGLAGRRFVAGRFYRGLADGGDAAPIEAALDRFPEIVGSLLEILEAEPGDWPPVRRLLAERDPALFESDWHEWLRE